MQRFHVHLSVSDLRKSVAFYNHLFGQQPSVEKSDYAKWSLEDPRVNFAISARGRSPGVNHLGMQAESTDELSALRSRAASASSGNLLDEGEAACCYARSNKHWTMDPDGIAWEHFHTLGTAEIYGEDEGVSSACCDPEEDGAPIKGEASCCEPSDSATSAPCCP